MRIKKKHIKEDIDPKGFKDAKGNVNDVEDATKELTGQLEKAGFEKKPANDIVTKAISGVIEDGKQSKSVKPKMSKNELVESVKNMTKNVESPRKVIKTFKVKDIKNGTK